MKKLSFIILFIILVFGKVYGTDYTYYVDADITDTHTASSTPDYTTYNHLTFATTGGTDSVVKTIADVNALFTVFSSSGNTITIYFKRGCTWSPQSVNTNLTIKKANFILDAYGGGFLPTLTGNGLWPSSGGSAISGGKNYYLLTVGIGASEVVDNWEIKNLRFYNTHSDDNPYEAGGGIAINGWEGATTPNTASGPGLISNCILEQLGSAAILLYDIENTLGSSGAIKIEDCTITRCALYWKGQLEAYGDYSGGPQSVNTCLGSSYQSYGHEIRRCFIYDTFREGIGACAFSVVEDNILGCSHGTGIYSSDYSLTATGIYGAQRLIRNNFLWYDSNSSYAYTTGGMDGVRIDDEGGSASNSECIHAIYGNVILGRRGTGIGMRHFSTSTTTWGPVFIFNNTLIDNTRNFQIGYNGDFTSTYILNNTAVITAASSCQHIDHYSSTSWATWNWGPNHWYGDEADTQDGMWSSPFYVTTGDNPDITSDPLFTGSNWQSTQSMPDSDKYYPGSTSPLVNSGVFLFTYTRSGNVLTIYPSGGEAAFYAGDTVYGDKRQHGVVESISLNDDSITLIDASSFDSSGSITPIEWYSNSPDMGAEQYVNERAFLGTMQ